MSIVRQTVSRAALLGCGVAMCVVCFAVAESTLLQRLPWPNPDHLVWLGVDAPGTDAAGFGLGEYETAIADLPQLVSKAPYLVASSTVLTPTGTERVTVAKVGGDFFHVIGAQPLKGRLLLPRDDERGVELAVVISENLSRRLGVANELIGSVQTFEERRFRVVGVLPQAVSYPGSVDAWMPIEPLAGAMLRSTNAPFIHAVGRVRRTDDIAKVATRVRSEPRARRGNRAVPTFAAEPLRDHLTKNVRGAIILFSGASATLLAIALLAAVTIQLAARERSEHELAIRAAIGASQVQLWRQILVEAVVTAFLAAGIGLLVSSALLVAGRVSGGRVVPELLTVSLNGRVYVAAAIMSLAASVFAVAVPMSSLLRANAADLLRRRSIATSSSRGSVAFRDTLTALSIGVTLLLVGAFAAAAQSLLTLLRVPTGFATNGIVVGTVRMPMPIVTPAEAERIRAFNRSFAQTVGAMANTDVAFSTDVPGRRNQSISIVRATDGAAEIQAGMTQVSPNYFGLVGINLHAGRLFEASDKSGASVVAVIDTDLARQLYPDDSPIGRTLAIAAFGGERVRIVGVVAPVRQGGRFAERMPQLYLSIEQLPLATFAIFTRGTSPDHVRELWKSAARAVEPGAAIGSVMALDDAVYGEMRRPTFYTIVLLSLASAAVLVSCAAVYASVAALVAQRTREIGIRMALGASPTAVAKMVVLRIGRVTLAGSMAGAAGLYLIWRLLETYGDAIARPTMLSVLGSIVLLWIAAGLAAFRPVRRATQINPIFALKD